MKLGLEIGRALHAGDFHEGKAISDGLEEACRRIGEGAPVVNAFRLSGMTLPVEAWSLLQAGEVTGRLGEAMHEVGGLLEAGERRRREITGQLWYPIMVLATAVGVMLVIVVWVIPQMREVSGEMGFAEDLPWLTRNIGILYAASLGFFLAIMGLAAGLWLLLRRQGRRSWRWAAFAESLVRRIPVFGRMFFWRREARLLRQISTLVTGGVTLPRALDMAAESCDSQWERRQLSDFRRRLVMGADLESGLNGCLLISPDQVSTILVGQESGQLDRFLRRVAVEQEDRMQWRIRQLLGLLEPAILLFLSVAVGLLILAYLLPMVRMLEQLA